VASCSYLVLRGGGFVSAIFSEVGQDALPYKLLTHGVRSYKSPNFYPQIFLKSQIKKVDSAHPTWLFPHPALPFPDETKCCRVSWKISGLNAIRAIKLGMVMRPFNILATMHLPENILL